MTQINQTVPFFSDAGQETMASGQQGTQQSLQQLNQQSDASFADKMKNTAAFTLVEMLAAIIVLTLLTGMVVTGMNLAVKTYEDSTFQSSSNVLSDTINVALGECAHTMYVQDEKATVYYRGYYITNAKLATESGELYINGTINGNAESIPLLNKGAYTGLKVKGANGQFGAEAQNGSENTLQSTFSYTVYSGSESDPTATKEVNNIAFSSVITTHRY